MNFARCLSSENIDNRQCTGIAYRYIYSHVIIKTIQMRNDSLLKGRQKKYLFLLLFQLCTLTLLAQVNIRGKVTDAAGQGVPAVSVTVRNTTFGTTTDESGQFVLAANVKPGSYTLVFSGVGFKSSEQAVQVTGTDVTANAQLQNDALGLDEVVVTGTSAGTTKRQLGSYISTVKGDELTKGATGNVLSALQGKTAGAQIIQNSGDPAGGVSVRLRGISSIGSSSEPLYIVDGIIVNNATTRVTNTSANYDGGNFVGSIGQNRMVDINPADIERVEVLNGAAAAAIYGSRANAGVVQIFTKRGKSGAPQIAFSTNVTMSELRKQVAYNRAPTKFGGSPDAVTQDILTPALTTTTPVTRYNYQDYIFRTGVGTDNNVSISGGTDKTKYFASGSYFLTKALLRAPIFNALVFVPTLTRCCQIS
jgi:TonB-dependent SusC/RagA subfamily outer membrane receptor